MPIDEKGDYQPLVRDKEDIIAMTAEFSKLEPDMKVQWLSGKIKAIMIEITYMMEDERLQDEGKGFVALLTLLSSNYQSLIRKWNLLPDADERLGEEAKTILANLDGLTFRSLHRLLVLLKPIIQGEKGWENDK